VAELDANGNIQALNTFGANGLVSRRTTATGASVFSTFDERGNVAQRVGGNRAVLSTDVYDGFGQKRPGATDVWLTSDSNFLLISRRSSILNPFMITSFLGCNRINPNGCRFLTDVTQTI